MILYDLRCRKGHVFEAWFRDSAAYDRQVAAGELACPTCGSKRVGKAPMAPRLGKGAGRRGGPAGARAETTRAGRIMRAMHELRRKVEENFDYVGGGFAEEARKIHYGEADPRNIYGETSEEEAEALRDEGVTFTRVPWPAHHDS